jgi:hypothetical protein
MAVDRGNLGCTLVALLAAWVTMVFGASALTVLFGIAGPRPSGVLGIVAGTWKAADAIGPVVKLLLIAIFAALVLLSERDGGSGNLRVRHALNGVGAMLLTLIVIPESLSRGFGAGVAGERFVAPLMASYLVAGALGGLVFTVSVARCRARLPRAAERTSDSQPGS